MPAFRKFFISSSFAILFLGVLTAASLAQEPAQQKDQQKPQQKSQKKDHQKDQSTTPANSAPSTANPNNTIDPKTYGGMKWRLIGPFRGGRVIAVTGVLSQPNTYYFGAVAGGVWKTTDGGMTWDPIFEKQNISSIGSIAVSDSDPNMIYVGHGRSLYPRQHFLWRWRVQVQ